MVRPIHSPEVSHGLSRRSEVGGVRGLPRVASLLELMQRFDPQLLKNVLIFIGQGSTVETVLNLSRKEDYERGFNSAVADEAANVAEMRALIQKGAARFRDHGFSLAARIMERMAEEQDAAAMFRSSPELRDRIKDELESVVLVRVPADEVRYFDQPALFGEAVAKRFPEAGHDVSEAGNCRAVGLYTACVFHLMRVMEIALRVISTDLKVPDPVKEADRNWGKMLERIDDELERRKSLTDPAWGPRRDFYRSAVAQLYAVKNAWRNPSMHVEAKHDQAEASRIFDAVKGFMEVLAGGLGANP